MKSKVVWIINNKFGKLWTDRFFFSKWEAEDYIEKFWSGTKHIVKKGEYEIIKVRLVKTIEFYV